jgi:NADPH:quinone reductase-like Zn-dependent oxidoreductase
MKAAIRKYYGGPVVIRVEDTADPVPGSGDLLIRVHAATVNRTDCGILTGKPYVMRLFTGLSKPKRIIIGCDFAGVVIERGGNVTEFDVGDRVWGFDDNGCGSHAELMTFPSDKAIMKIPGNMNFDEAVACAEGAHYAFNFINKVKLRPGMKVMVNGGTGAIGSAAIQMLKYHGMHVVATAPTDHLTTVKDLGADRVIDYQNTDFTMDDEEYDLVFDSVGKSSFKKCKRIMKGHGVYISSELGDRNENPWLALISPFTMGKKVKFPLPVNIKRSMKFVGRMVEEGRFRPLIDRSFELNKVSEAFSYVMSEQKIGNVILKMK